MEAFDPNKSRRNVARRGLPFDGFEAIFDGPYVSAEDRRTIYPEQRINVLGLLHGEIVHLTWTPMVDETGEEYPRAISLRPATPEEKLKYVRFLQGR